MFNNFLERVRTEEHAGIITTTVAFLIGTPLVVILGYFLIRGFAVALDILRWILDTFFAFAASLNIAPDMMLFMVFFGLFVGCIGILVGQLILESLAERNYIRSHEKDIQKLKQEFKELQEKARSIDSWNS